jgi:hypothetical protein
MGVRRHPRIFASTAALLSCVVAFSCASEPTSEPVHAASAGRTAGTGAGGAHGEDGGQPGTPTVPEAGAGGADAGGRSPLGTGGEEADAGAAGASEVPEPAAPIWRGSLGSSCGAGDVRRSFLVATPQANSCREHAELLSASGADSLTAELPADALESPSSTMSVQARYCRGGACEDAELVLKLRAEGDGFAGDFQLRFENGRSTQGTLEAAACEWLAGAPPPGEPFVRGLEVRELAVFQGVKIPLLERGLELTSRKADIVIGRPALFRAYVVPQAGFRPRPVRAKLIVANDDEAPRVFEQELTVAAASTDAELESTFQFEVGGELIRRDSRYAFELYESEACAAEGERNPGRFPETGTYELGARRVGEVVVEIVPIRLTTDRRSYLPDTSPAQLEAMRKALLGLFPIAAAELRLRAEPLDSSAASVLELIDEVAALRDAENPGRNVSYYGMFRYTEELESYCTTSCVLGAGIVGDQLAPRAGTAVGIGYTGERAASTFAHELGHVYGREHTPCGVAGDAAYPYSGGRIGSWGYDLWQKKLLPPTHTDFMGYCTPVWVSDYVFGRLGAFIAAVNTDVALLRSGPPLHFRTLILRPGAAPRWGRSRAVAGEPPGVAELAELFGGDGAARDVVVYRAALADVGAEMVYVPEEPGVGAGIRVRGQPRVRYPGPAF